MSRRRVCLFGLSADPPTAAHVGMVGTLCQQGDFDEIRMMPVYQHQFSVSLTNRENNHDYLFKWLSQDGLHVVCCWPKGERFRSGWHLCFDQFLHWHRALTLSPTTTPRTNEIGWYHINIGCRCVNLPLKACQMLWYRIVKNDVMNGWQNLGECQMCLGLIHTRIHIRTFGRVGMYDGMWTLACRQEQSYRVWWLFWTPFSSITLKHTHMYTYTWQ